MKMQTNNVEIRLSGSAHDYQIRIGEGILSETGAWAHENLKNEAKKIAIVSNPKVFGLYGGIVETSLREVGYETAVWLMKDGERHKNLRSFESALAFFGGHNLSRTDAVVALGGGVVGDLAGFAAAAHLRGIAFLQIPTTFLSMIDSSVGGKTGVNTTFGKNLVGAFHQPHGVLIDIKTLQTLPRRELTAGFCEAVKQAAIASKNLFEMTAGFLKKYPLKNFKKYYGDRRFSEDLINLLAEQIGFKSLIVTNDEKESVGRSDGKSRKILNFGHTLAHALEKVTDYKHFKHGEAVGYGILFAARLSKSLEILDENELNLLNDVVKSVGQLPKLNGINAETLIEAFKFDKKSVGSSLQWILLKKIGDPIILPDSQVPESILRNTLETVLIE